MAEYVKAKDVGEPGAGNGAGGGAAIPGAEEKMVRTAESLYG